MSRHLGAENLFIIAHGQDDWISELCPRAHVVVAPRDNLARFDQKRGQMLNAVQDELGEIFDWVIRTDADELICLDPSRFGSLSEMFESTTAPLFIKSVPPDAIEIFPVAVKSSPEPLDIVKVLPSLTVSVTPPAIVVWSIKTFKSTLISRFTAIEDELSAVGASDAVVVAIPLLIFQLEAVFHDISAPESVT